MSEYIVSGSFYKGGDNEEIVRCRDCKYYSEHEWVIATDVSDVCHFWHGEPTKVAPDGFCAWGERNDNSAPEKVVSDEDDGSNDTNMAQDSREKLEADVRKHYAYSITTLMYPPSANKVTDMLGALPVDTVIGWLDRQEAITKREWCDEQGFWNCAEDAVMLSAQVVQLIHERDEWKTKCETREFAYKQADAERQRYSEQIDELTDELENARAKNRLLKSHISKMQEGRRGWHVEADKLQKSVDEYREKLSRALDLAHEIERLMP